MHFRIILEFQHFITRIFYYKDGKVFQDRLPYSWKWRAGSWWGLQFLRELSFLQRTQEGLVLDRQWCSMPASQFPSFPTPFLFPPFSFSYNAPWEFHIVKKPSVPFDFPTKPHSSSHHKEISTIKAVLLKFKIMLHFSTS